MYHTSQSVPVVALGSSPEAMMRAEKLARCLKVPLENEESTQLRAVLRLVVTDSHLELRGDEQLAGRGVMVDFVKHGFHFVRGQSSRRQPLGRAIGRRAASVVDATAGMGQDSCLLACMGYQVLAFERSPIIAALLEDGLRRAGQDPMLVRVLQGTLQFEQGDAREALASMTARPDVVYLDPMFPPKRRASALPKKEIQLLRSVVGDDDDAASLLEIACHTAQQRVVVKRPTHAPPLSEPTMCIESKLVRYDVYVVS